MRKMVIKRKKEEKLNIFSDSHYLNLEKKRRTLKFMNNFGIILGEYNSINSEILAKSKAFKSKAIIIGNHNLLKSQLRILKIKRKLKKIEKPEEYFIILKNSLNILDVPLKFKKAFSVSDKYKAQLTLKNV